MATPAAPKMLLFSDLGAVALRLGDSDSNQRWGGQFRPEFAGAPVFELQSALVAVGTLAIASGNFDVETQNALKRFQWYRENMGFRLKLAPGAAPSSGVITPCFAFISATRGICDQNLAADLLEWVTGNFVTTTPLVRLNTKDLSNVHLSEQFTMLTYPSAQPGEILLHPSFAAAVSGAFNDEAKNADVHLQLNQTFRRADVPPTGAVVAPAAKSRHLVGHAVDLNIVDGGTINTASMFLAKRATAAALAFIQAVKTQGYRWGGDFATVDPVHFDDALDSEGEEYAMTHFFAQLCFHAQHPMRQLN
jgi:hypothetical protein